MSAMTSTGAMEETRALEMGQAPGTHWYRAHKHGSTTIDVANGMTGAFIIEGGYDDALNSFYNADWTGPQPWARAQPVFLINQLQDPPNLFGGGATRGGPLSFSVNGRFQPEITMQPGQVQLWRIANTSSRGGVFLAIRPCECDGAEFAADLRMEADRAGWRAVQRAELFRQSRTRRCCCQRETARICWSRHHPRGASMSCWRSRPKPVRDAAGQPGADDTDDRPAARQTSRDADPDLPARMAGPPVKRERYWYAGHRPSGSVYSAH